MKRQRGFELVWARFGRFAGAALLLSGCEAGGEAGGGSNGKPLAPEEALDAPLSELGPLFEGVPSNDELPVEGKADAIYPATLDLIATQSPVKNQQRRGVCSIFSTLALMEHLYIKEGTIKNPDFSEQFLQWSVKNEVGAFRDTDGSNAGSNLESINRYGVVEEADWPYEGQGWGTDKNPACTGEKRPVECYTNGAPPESALAATRWKLPRGRYVNSSARSLKAVMTEKKTAVVVGMDFFYQSWNHGGSALPINRDYFSEGYVLYPTEKDKEESKKKPAGHSILLLGWDDTLEVPMLDAEGKPVVDEQGNPKKEKGFFLFKNSWGTGGFGLRNKFGAGYGWISMRYVEEYAGAYTADVPKLELTENCTDGKDNNFNNLSDCLDSACADNDACREVGTLFTNTSKAEIPDGNSTGVVSSIAVPNAGTVDEVRVKLDVQHPYIGDLVVTLVAPDGSRAKLHDKQGGGDDNIKKSFKVDALVGKAAKGTWKLELVDAAKGDKGSLVSWSLELKLSGGEVVEVCDDGIDNDGVGGADCADSACASATACEAADTLFAESTTEVAIPDGDPSGVLSELTFDREGIVQSFVLAVNIEHPYRADLTVSLLAPDGTFITVHNQEGDDADNLVAEFPLAQLVGTQAAGTYTLEVIDHANLDAGKLLGWTIEAVVK
jgi:subtilisin-like proprotein convertase family protein/C1A family cysteine protease